MRATGYAEVEKRRKALLVGPGWHGIPNHEAVEDLPAVSAKGNSSSSNEQQEVATGNTLAAFKVAGAKDYHQELHKGIDLYHEGDYFSSFQRFNAVNVLAENDDNNRLAELGSQLRDSAVQKIQLLSRASGECFRGRPKYPGGLLFLQGKVRFSLWGEKRAKRVFYFIDKAGNEFQKLGRWRKAEQFDYKGFAKVVDEKGMNYLLDSGGRTYRVAYRLEDLDAAITALDLRRSKLNAFPKAILKHPQLNVLLLDGEYYKKENSFTYLSTGIQHLINLSVLSLQYCQIQSLPLEIGQLSNLTSLDLRGNELTSLPTEIGQLSNLNTLYLQNNQLTSLPPEVRQLTNLVKLNLEGNELTSLPTEIGS